MSLSKTSCGITNKNENIDNLLLYERYKVLIQKFVRETKTDNLASRMEIELQINTSFLQRLSHYLVSLASASFYYQTSEKLIDNKSVVCLILARIPFCICRTKNIN